MANESKLMGRKGPTTGKLTDVKVYDFLEYDGDADLVDMDAHPTGFGPWTYNAATKLAEAAVSLLSLSVSALTVTPDGVATGTVTLTGPANSVVNADFDGPVPIDAVQWTLDGSGNKVVTLGPTTLRTVKPIKIKFDLDDGSSPVPIELELTLQ